MLGWRCYWSLAPDLSLIVSPRGARLVRLCIDAIHWNSSLLPQKLLHVLTLFLSSVLYFVVWILLYYVYACWIFFSFIICPRNIFIIIRYITWNLRGKTCVGEGKCQFRPPYHFPFATFNLRPQFNDIFVMTRGVAPPLHWLCWLFRLLIVRIRFILPSLKKAK